MLSLEVGKTYEDGFGTLQLITGPNVASRMYTFMSDMSVYTKSGQSCANDSRYDLVREVIIAKAPPVPTPTVDVLLEVQAERAKQDRAFGQQDHHPFKWMSILTEEVGEAAMAANDADAAEDRAEDDAADDQWDAYRAELVQVAAVAIAMIESFDRNLEAAEDDV